VTRHPTVLTLRSLAGILYLALVALAVHAAVSRPGQAGRPSESARAALPSTVPGTPPARQAAPALARLRPPARAALTLASRHREGPRVSSRTPGRPVRWDEDLYAHPKKGQFRRFFRMKATAYTPINTRMEGGRYTKTRKDGRSEHGVAVDPELIPLGSRLWIPGYGHAIADDVGGRIQGHRIDVRVQDGENLSDWGHRRVRVYVLQDPPGYWPE
jgi:3D (Asp-Asp-Asp) domain-containing protein